MKKMLLLPLLVLATTVLQAQRISIQPSILNFTLGPSSTYAHSVRIANLSDKKMVFRAYLADWLRDTTGAHQYFRPDTLQRSCASWVHLSRTLVEVEPGATEELVVQLQTPAQSQRFNEMKWAMLFLQSTEEKTDAATRGKEMQTQVKELLRVGIHIYQTPPSVTALAAKALSFEAAGSEKNTYELTMQNAGAVMLQCKSYVELTHIETGTEYKLNRVEFPVFPEGTRKVKFTIPSTVPAGKYSALAVLDIGEDMPLEAIEKVIEVK